MARHRDGFDIDWDGLVTPSPRGPNTLLAFACGAIAGTALGLLFAPAHGRETRRRIATTSRRLGEKLDSAADVTRSVSGAIRDARTAFDRARTRQMGRG